MLCVAIHSSPSRTFHKSSNKRVLRIRRLNLTSTRKNMLKFASKRQDSLLEIVPEVTEVTIGRRIVTFSVCHVRIENIFYRPCKHLLIFPCLADNFRPYLTSFQGNAFTDYINAVFVDGYTKPRGNIAHIV